MRKRGAGGGIYKDIIEKAHFFPHINGVRCKSKTKAVWHAVTLGQRYYRE